MLTPDEMEEASLRYEQMCIGGCFSRKGLELLNDLIAKATDAQIREIVDEYTPEVRRRLAAVWERARSRTEP